MHQESILTSTMHKEDITSTLEDTSFYMETHMRENHKFLFFFFNSLHIFVDNDLLLAPTPRYASNYL